MPLCSLWCPCNGMIPYEIMDINHSNVNPIHKVYPIKFVQGFVVLCIVMVMILLLVDSHNALTPILQGYFAGTGVIIRLSQCQWSNPEGCKLNRLIPNHKKIQQVKNYVHFHQEVLHYNWSSVSLQMSKYLKQQCLVTSSHCVYEMLRIFIQTCLQLLIHQFKKKLPSDTTTWFYIDFWTSKMSFIVIIIMMVFTKFRFHAISKAFIRTWQDMQHLPLFYDLYWILAKNSYFPLGDGNEIKYTYSHNNQKRNG